MELPRSICRNLEEIRARSLIRVNRFFNEARDTSPRVGGGGVTAVGNSFGALFV